MAVASGRVQRLTLAPSLACVWIGPTLNSAELLFVVVSAVGPARELGFAQSVIAVLVRAVVGDYPVQVWHDDDGALITSVTLEGYDISPVGPPIHEDFYAITGRNIPDNAQVVFDLPVADIVITPDVVRPHWVLIEALPTQIPAGWCAVRLEAPGWSSRSVPVRVRSGPRTTVRTLYPGEAKAAPYTIALVANPAIQALAGGGVTADTVLTDRAGYHDTVRYCVRDMLRETEALLRNASRDERMRWVSIFDGTRAATTANALAHELAGTLMEPVRDRLNTYITAYGEHADIVFVIHGSTTHDRAAAWFSTDAAGGTAYTLDGVARTHGHGVDTPGSAAIPTNVDQTGLTALHEFGHAASDFNNGMVIDLYTDGGSGLTFPVNKKFRALAANPVPVAFATYNATTYNSDQNRDSLGYDAGWRSYHPTPLDATRPNMMDNYWFAFDDPHRCQLDELVEQWLANRLQAKLRR